MMNYDKFLINQTNWSKPSSFSIINTCIKCIICLQILLFASCSKSQTSNDTICIEVANYFVKIKEVQNRNDSINSYIKYCTCLIDKNSTAKFQFLIIGKRFDEAKSLIEGIPEERFTHKDQSKSIHLNLINSLIFHSKKDTLRRDSCFKLLQIELEKVLYDNQCDISSTFTYANYMSIFYSKEFITNRLKKIIQEAKCEDFDVSLIEHDEIYSGRLMYNVE